MKFGAHSILLAAAISTYSFSSKIWAQAVEPKNWSHEMLTGPAHPEDTKKWHADLDSWRQQTHNDFFAQDPNWDRNYKNPKLLWTQTNFVQPQVMAHDRYLYDSEKNVYTVDRFLNDVNRRYGGVDSVLIWPTYPNIGIDERNQYDLTRDMPGGLDGLRQMVSDFHRRGVKVLFPLNPWDNGTRDEGLSHAQAIAKILSEVGADGFNGDTMSAVGKEFFDEGQRLGQDFVIEPEVGLSDNLYSLAWNLMSWGYWMDYQFTPGVSRYKWIEPRHMTHVCRRESHDRLDELQYAWFNGAGYESWENLWGTWNGMTPRDSETLRRISFLYRNFSKIWSSPNWVPHVSTLQPGVFSSIFPGQDLTLWTFVNRTPDSKVGSQISVPYHGEIFFDLWHGVELTPTIKGEQAELKFDIDRNGYGAVVALSKTQKPSLAAVIKQMHRWAKKPLSQYSSTWRPLSQKMYEAEALRSKNEPAPTENMIYVPTVRNFEFNVSSVAIEKYEGGDFQYPWEPSAKLEHRHVLFIPGFYIDRNLVTNLEYKTFLESSHYWPKDAHNFLRHWVDGKIPSGAENHPVTWVSLEDVRAYAKWAGKRLPHEWEWQYAAQGGDGRAFPWGNDWNSKFVATPTKGREAVAPEAVGLHPEGASPFGLLDMVGNVWQWTDEFIDEHTRAAVLRGGARYRAEGSDWYFPLAYRLDQHGKYLLMAPSLDRSGSIGFRCAK